MKSPSIANAWFSASIIRHEDIIILEEENGYKKYGVARNCFTPLPPTFFLCCLCCHIMLDGDIFLASDSKPAFYVDARLCWIPMYLSHQ